MKRVVYTSGRQLVVRVRPKRLATAGLYNHIIPTHCVAISWGGRTREVYHHLSS